MDVKKEPPKLGPWTAFENVEGWTVADKDGNAVAYCDHQMDGGIEGPSPAEAHARFIAAAPEMLDTLRLAESALLDAALDRNWSLEQIKEHEPLATVRAVIAKASGGTESAAAESEAAAFNRAMAEANQEQEQGQRR